MVARQKYLHAVKGVVCLDFSQSESPRHVQDAAQSWEGKASNRPGIWWCFSGSSEMDAVWNSSALFAFARLWVRVGAGSGHHQGDWLLYKGHRGSLLALPEIRLKPFLVLLFYCSNAFIRKTSTSYPRIWPIFYEGIIGEDMAKRHLTA